MAVEIKDKRHSWELTDTLAELAYLTDAADAEVEVAGTVARKKLHFFRIVSVSPMTV